MAGQVSPGVVIKERDLTNARIDNTIDNVGAIAGPFERGPVNEMTNIVMRNLSWTLLVLPTLTTQNIGLPLPTSWHTVVNSGSFVLAQALWLTLCLTAQLLS